MSTIVNCPSCQRKLKVPEELLGKKVKCPGCGGMFEAAEEIDESPPPSRPKREESRRSPREEEAERPSERRRRPARDDDDDDEDSRARRPARSSRRDEYDDDEDDDRPRRATRSSRLEEDDDDDDRPRRSARSSRYEEDEGDDDEETPSRPSRSQAREGWRQVARGLNFILWAIVAAIGGGIAVACAMFIGIGATFGALMGGGAAPAGPGAGPGPGGAAGAAAVGGIGIVIVGILAIGLLLGVSGAIIAGKVFCLNVPARNEARRYAMISLVLSISGLALSALAFIVGMIMGAAGAINPMALIGGGGSSALIGILDLIGGIVGVGSHVTFVMFMRLVAEEIRKRSLAQSLLTLIIVISVSGGCLILSRIIALVGVAGGGAAAAAGNPAIGFGAMGGAGMASGALGCIFAITAIASVIWFIVSLVQVRGAVLQYNRRR